MGAYRKDCFVAFRDYFGTLKNFLYTEGELALNTNPLLFTATLII